VFDLVLTFLQRFCGIVIGLHGLLSRCRAARAKARPG
jgi:hypothetical protein